MKTILVVDDNRVIRDVLSVTLTALLKDCSIKTAENGARAAEIFDSSSVNAIMTDLCMPMMDGYQLMEHVRDRSSDVPIIAMTAEPGPEVDDRLKSLGVIRCFEKPFDFQEVIREIASVLTLTGTAVMPVHSAAAETVLT